MKYLIKNRQIYWKPDDLYVYASTFTIALLDIAKYFVLFWHAFTFDLVNCLYVRILILP